jgi:hypothetical protein
MMQKKGLGFHDANVPASTINVISTTYTECLVELRWRLASNKELLHMDTFMESITPPME